MSDLGHCRTTSLCGNDPGCNCLKSFLAFRFGILKITNMGSPVFLNADIIRLFSAACQHEQDSPLLVVTVNSGTTLPDGSPMRQSLWGTMGAGVAKLAATRYPGLWPWWNARVCGGVRDGFHLWDEPVEPIENSRGRIGVLVTKQEWHRPSPPDLIAIGLASLRDHLQRASDEGGFPPKTRVFLPLPGGGLGKLPAQTSRDLCRQYLNERAVVCEWKK